MVQKNAKFTRKEADAHGSLSGRKREGRASSAIVGSLYARISVMEKLRPQPRDKNREIVDRRESERGEVLWVVRENLG